MSEQVIRVAVIDDDEDDFVLVRLALRGIATPRFELEWFKDARSGLAAMRAGLADVYLVDYLLGGESGLTVLMEAIAAGVRAPIVLLTGQGSPEIDAAAQSAGAADYLVKRELDPARLGRSIRYALDRSRARRAIEDSEARYRLLFERNPSPMWVTDLVTRRFLAVNDAAIDHYGWSREEFLAMAIEDIHPEEDRDYFVGAHNRASLGLFGAGLWRHRCHDERLIEVEVASHSVEFAGRSARLSLINDVTERLRAERSLREREVQLRTLFGDVSDALIVVDAGNRIVFANPAAAVLMADPGGDPVGRVFDFGIRADGSIETLKLPGGESRAVEARATETVWGGAEARLYSIRDVTERQRTEENLRLLERAIDASVGGITIADARASDMPMRYVSAGFVRMTGYEPHEVLGRNCRFLQAHDTAQPEIESIRRAIQNSESVTVVLRNYRKDGSLFWNQVSIAPVRNERGEVTHIIGSQYDITERRRYEAELAYLATHDAVTGVPRYIAVEEYARGALAEAARNGGRVVLLYIDLDRFHVVNESMGHGVGDHSLRAVAERIRREVSSDGRVSRIAGDEFVVVYVPHPGDSEGFLLADRIRRAIEVPIPVAPYSVYLTCSIGISVYPETANDAGELLNQAEAAMGRAKRVGRNAVQRFSNDQLQELADRLSLGSRLRDAPRKGELLLHYQPQVSAQNGQIIGLEALVRWQSPELGFLPPGRFIRVAEELGLIVELGNWVLDSACRQAKSWLDQGLGEFTVAVNVSAMQLHRPSFVDEVKSALARSGLPPRCLELELTESSIMESVDRMSETMKALRELGVRLALDDFGVGYSSLNYLKRFPIEKLKIDQSFVLDIARDRGDAGIARAIVAMGHQLGMTVMAEGVETVAQAGYLRRNHCDLFQGMLFSGPVSAERATDLLRRRVLASEFFATGGDERSLLLLDDEENILRALTRLLRRDGYQILTASTAREAFEILGRQEIQVVVSDQRMPDISGTEFLNQVRVLYPDTVRLVLSGYTDLRTVTDAINRGSIYKFLTKPWDDEELRKEIREAFRTHAERSATIS